MSRRTLAAPSPSELDVQTVVRWKHLIARIVTDTQAEAVLAEVRPWLRHQRPIAQVRAELEATVGTVLLMRLATGFCRTADEAFRQARRSTQQIKTALHAVEGSAAALHMSFPLDAVMDALIAVNKLEQALSSVPKPFSEQQRPQKGPTPRAWYPRFVRNLTEIAEASGIDVTTGGDRNDDPHATAFTRFVFAVEKLLPPGERSPSLAACAKRIDRAIVASTGEICEVVESKGRRRKPSNSGLRDK
jgi:hypothetical protein